MTSRVMAALRDHTHEPSGLTMTTLAPRPISGGVAATALWIIVSLSCAIAPAYAIGPERPYRAIRMISPTVLPLINHGRIVRPPLVEPSMTIRSLACRDSPQIRYVRYYRTKADVSMPILRCHHSLAPLGLNTTISVAVGRETWPTANVSLVRCRVVSSRAKASTRTRLSRRTMPARCGN
jgi:hypothetical protein